jgi:hypothetical protein
MENIHVCFGQKLLHFSAFFWFTTKFFLIKLFFRYFRSIGTKVRVYFKFIYSTLLT